MADVKLRNLRITIISKINCIFYLLISLPCIANDLGVSVKKENGEWFYFIEVYLSKDRKHHNERIAPIYAKANLVKYFKQSENISSLDLKEFTLVKKSTLKDKVYFLFKIKSENIKVNK